ncbi:hypothetical protein IT570_14220 [Candidatus Sumerlaeota bacterium]|nr:hypothetical protein [Candidatus Sumerlaeota bacterium]
MSAARIPDHKALQEDLVSLIGRWLKAPSPDCQKPVDLTPHQIAERVIRRAEGVMKFLNLEDAAVTPAIRWRNLWSPDRPTNILRDKLKQLGWTVRFIESPKQLSSHSVMDSAGRDTIFLELPAAEALARAVMEAGFPAPFAAQDAIPVLLAGELYDVAAPQLGHQPKGQWVDDLARPLVVQRLVGLPFNPLALTII